MNKTNKLNNKGIAALPTIMLLGMMTLAIVVSVTSITFNQMFISQGQSQSQNALFYAESGARDALTRIARDKTYSCISDDCYNIDYVSNGCVNNTDCSKVTVSAGLGTTADPKIITSKGIMKSSVRKMEVRVVLDGGTTDGASQKGQITETVWTELTN